MTVRDGHGRYDRDPQVAARDAEACRLRARGYLYDQIAAELGISKTQAYESVKRALKETLQEPADEVRQLELMQLDELARAARKVLEGTHYVVSHGKVVRLVEDGPPLEDDAPVLAAIDRLVKISESRRKLLGLDIPVKQLIGGDVQVTYHFEGVDLSGLQ